VNLLDRAFLWIRNCMLCYRFALFTRILLAAAFIPTGMVKLQGHRFTTMPVDTPIGAFFEAMFQTGLFWNFIGLAQVVAGVLLLVPGLAHLGAAMFLPIMLNIVVITIGLGFGGTAFVTVPMLLAVVFLCAYDFHRFRSMLTTRPLDFEVPAQRLDGLEKVGFTVFAVSLIGVFGITRDLYVAEMMVVFMITGFAAGLFTLARFLWVWWHQRPTAAGGNGVAAG